MISNHFCLVLFLCALFLSSSTKLTIDLNRRGNQEKAQSKGEVAKAKPVISMTNSHTNVKVSTTNGRMSSSPFTDNSQKWEKMATEYKYFKKGDSLIGQKHSPHRM